MTCELDLSLPTYKLNDITFLQLSNAVYVKCGFTVSNRELISSVAIVGGLLLLVNIGPGGISVDEKKKVS